MGAKTPSTPIAVESFGTTMLYTLDFSDIDDGDTYTDDTLTDVVGYWANATDTMTKVASGPAVDVAYTQTTGAFTFSIGEDNRPVKLYLLRRQV